MGGILSFGSYKVESGKVKGKLPPKIEHTGSCMMYGLKGKVVKKREKDGTVNWKVVQW